MPSPSAAALQRRQARAIALATRSRIRVVEEGRLVRVPSESRADHSYDVVLTDTGWSCSCSDFEGHANGGCKHVRAVRPLDRAISLARALEVAGQLDGAEFELIAEVLEDTSGDDDAGAAIARRALHWVKAHPLPLPEAPAGAPDPLLAQARQLVAQARRDGTFAAHVDRLIHIACVGLPRQAEPAFDALWCAVLEADPSIGGFDA